MSGFLGTINGFISKWGSHIALASATAFGGGLGAGLNYTQLENMTPQTSSVGKHPPLSPQNAHEPEDDVFNAKTPGFHDGKSFRTYMIGKQLVGPAAETLATPFSHYQEAVGSYWQSYAIRTEFPRDEMFSVGWRRAFYSRKALLGKIFRNTLPKEMRTRPLTDEDRMFLRTGGADKRSMANKMMLVPYLTKLAVYGIAISQMDSHEKGGLFKAENGVIVADTAMTLSHTVDYSFYAAGQKAIFNGNEARATRLLTTSHRISIGSNVLSFFTGGARLYVEAKSAGRSDPITLFFAFMDIACGITGIIYSNHILKRVKKLLRKEKADENTSGNGVVNNTLLGIFNLPTLVQDTMRVTNAISSSAILGINLSNFLYLQNHPEFQNFAMRTMGMNASTCQLGIAGATSALLSAYLLTPASYPISRWFMLGSVAFTSLQFLFTVLPSLSTMF